MERERAIAAGEAEDQDARASRVVVEVARGRRIIRDYDAAGALVRIRIEPATRGVTADMPPLPAPTAPAPRPRKMKEAREAKEAPPAPPPEPAPVAAAAPPPEPEPIVEAPPPPPPPAPKRGFKVIAKSVVPPPPPPEPEPAPPIVVEPEPAPPAVVEPEPTPAPARRYEVPDLDTRVDALLQKRDRPARARKRAPLPVPQFEPLKREPWEDRLDKALGRS